MGLNPTSSDHRPEGAVAAALDTRVAWFAEDPKISHHPLGVGGNKVSQTVSVGVDFFLVIKHPGDVVSGVIQCGSEDEVACHSPLHVDTSPTPQVAVFDAGRECSGNRNGVQVPGNEDARWAPGLCSRRHSVPVSDDFQVSGARQGCLNPVGEVFLIPGHTVDVTQKSGQLDNTGIDRQGARRWGHASSVSGVVDSTSLVGMSAGFAHGYGLQTIDSSGQVLDTWFPEPKLGAAPEGFEPRLVPSRLAHLEGEDPLREVTRIGVGLEITLDDAPRSVADAYLRLHLLSHTLVRPNSVSLEGIFQILPIVAFTTRGPVSPDVAERKRIDLQDAGAHIVAIDRFGPMTNYVVPEGVRIADTSRVRLGAHLASGTTVMHEGFVNFNAGTLGHSMVEGRISQGVIVGDGSDIGGGASIMGTLSGGGKEVVSIGKRCLLGANSGVGISLGDDCVVEAGLYVTAGIKITLFGDGEPRAVKARELSGSSGLLFRRNSENGAVEALPRSGVGVALNPALHSV